MAGRFSSLFTALTGSTAAAPVPPTPPAPPAGVDALAGLELDDSNRAEFAAELQGFLATREAAGFKAANDRVVKVMGSDKGKAHSTMALTLLGNEKLSALTADEILASLPEAPVASTPTPAPAPTPPAADQPAATGSKAHQERLAGAPKLALGNAASTEASVEATDASKGETKAKAVGLWGKTQGVTEGGTTRANGTQVSVGAAR